MRVLLDTHVALWIVAGDPRLSPCARRTYEEAEVLYFSVASLWEIGIKLGLRRADLSLSADWWQVLPGELTRQGVLRLEVTPEHCREVSLLPLHHRDPFDRMLLAQARVESCALLSVDHQLDAYGITRIW